MDKGFKYLLIDAKFKPTNTTLVSIPGPLTFLFPIYQMKSFGSQTKSINSKLIVRLK